MRWPWARKPVQPEIPAYKTPVIDFKPLTPVDPSYIVEERDMSEKTGMFYFPWLHKKKRRA